VVSGQGRSPMDVGGIVDAYPSWRGHDLRVGLEPGHQPVRPAPLYTPIRIPRP
jgi:hypothetical protein